MDRTYYASVESGRRNISLQNIEKIANGLNISLSTLFGAVEEFYDLVGGAFMHKYIINTAVKFNCGFPLSIDNVIAAIHNTNNALENLPVSLFRSIDYKTTSAMIGCILCENIALTTNGVAVVNPIEKGHPDIIPRQALGSSEEQLRIIP